MLTDLEGLEGRAKWPGLRSVIVVVRERTAGGKNSCEKHYYISSRTMSAEQFLKVIRGHWGIENSLHWVLDVVFDEDRSRVRKDHAPENFGLLRRMAVSMLKAEGSKGSIRGKRLIAGWNNDLRASVILRPRSFRDHCGRHRGFDSLPERVEGLVVGEAEADSDLVGDLQRLVCPPEAALRLVAGAQVKPCRSTGRARSGSGGAVRPPHLAVPPPRGGPAARACGRGGQASRGAAGSQAQWPAAGGSAA